MKKNEFLEGVVEKNNKDGNIDWAFDRSAIVISDKRRPDVLNTSILKMTTTNYTKENLDLINNFFADNKGLFKGWDQAYKKYTKTREYKKLKAHEDAFDLAVEAGLIHDEHGGYGRGDSHSIDVIDVLYNKKDLKKFDACGNILALVENFRKRTYSRKYMSMYGGSTRSDYYLVGTNENNVPFVHGVSRNCTSVKEAVLWIWNGNKILSRQGDVAVAPCQIKNPEGSYHEDYVIHDNHHFSGEVCIKRNTLYIRKGKMFHIKNQHPDIDVGDDWVKVIIARRAAVGGSHD